MATINYTKVGWDNDKFFNPTNMNHMDDGIKAACDAYDSIDGLTLKGSAVAITTYPTKAGVYTVGATKPTGLPSASRGYGNLVIMGGGYYTHLYHDSNSDLYVGRSSGGSVTAPASWKKVTMA